MFCWKTPALPTDLSSVGSTRGSSARGSSTAASRHVGAPFGAWWSHPCWTHGFISTCRLPSWVREKLWGANCGDAQKPGCPGGRRSGQARMRLCPFVGWIMAAERSWSLEMGLGGRCWCHDGASCTWRAGAELTPADGRAHETCRAARGWMAGETQPGMQPSMGRISTCLVEPVGN